MRFNYLTRLLTPRGYGIVCMLVAHNTCTIHTETSAPVVCCYYTCILWSIYLQDRAHYQAYKRVDVVRAQELLALGANVDRELVSYMHVEHTWVCWVSIH